MTSAAGKIFAQVPLSRKDVYKDRNQQKWTHKVILFFFFLILTFFLSLQLIWWQEHSYFSLSVNVKPSCSEKSTSTIKDKHNVSLRWQNFEQSSAICLFKVKGKRRPKCFWSDSDTGDGDAN